LVPSSILSELVENLPLVAGAEVTLEANPEDITPARLEEWSDLGVTRLSVGVQTFDVDQAKRLSRGKVHHRLKSILNDVQSASFRTWSFDLIFGLPNQSLDALRSELDSLLLIRPPHVSLYGLTYEPGTPFERGLRKGLISPISEEVWSEQFELISSRLTNAGYSHYEISNFALEGHRSQHNESIWRNGVYAGLGPGAHGFLPDGQRTVFESDWNLWWGESPMKIEIPTPNEAVIDAMLTWIRHSDGIVFEDLREMGWLISPRVTTSLTSKGLLWNRNGSFGLTFAGKLIADSVTLQLIDGIEPLGTV